MKCVDHPRELKAQPNGAFTCPLCEGQWLDDATLELVALGAQAKLSVETRDDSPVFVKVRQCPTCERPLTPLRIGTLEAWVDRCPACEAQWVEKSDLRSLTMLTKSAARAKAWESFTPVERKEAARDLAVAAKPEEVELTAAQQVLAFIGVPMLERIGNNRVPWLSWSFAAMVVGVAVLGVVWPESFSVQQLGYRPEGGSLLDVFSANFAHFNALHLLGNVPFLIAFGDAVEQRLNRGWLAFAFLVMGPATLFAQGLADEKGSLIAGASGAVAALVGMAAVLHSRASVITTVARLFVVRWPLPLFAAGELIGNTAWLAVGVPGVAWVAHLVGLVAGLALGFALRHAPAPTP